MRKTHVVLVVMALLVSCSGENLPARAEAADELEPVQPSEVPDRDLVNGLLAKCLQSKGWPVSFTPGPGNGIRYETSDPSAQASMQADMERCLEDLIDEGIVPDPSRPLSDEYWLQVYERDVTVRECLLEHGYPAPELVSFDSYLEMRTDQHVLWDPFSELYGLAGTDSEHILTEAFETCVEAS